MWHSLAKSSRLWIVIALSLIPMAAHALEVDYPGNGFHFTLPDDFTREPNPKGKDILCAYRRLPKITGEAGAYVEVKAVKGTIGVGQRLNPSTLETEEGFNIGFDQIEWQTHKLDLIISTPKDPEKAAQVVVYTCLFPLSGQAIRFRVAGPPGGDNAARAFFDKTVATFTNTKPLETKPEEDPLTKMGAFAFKLCLGIFVAVVFGRMVMRMAKGKPKKPKAGPPQAGPPVIRRPQ